MSNQAQLVPNVVFDGHLAIGVLGLLAFIVHQVVSKPFYLFYDFPRLWQIQPEIEVVLKVYDSIATVGEIRVWWRANFQSGSRVREYFQLRQVCWLIEETDQGEFNCDCPVGFK